MSVKYVELSCLRNNNVLHILPMFMNICSAEQRSHRHNAKSAERERERKEKRKREVVEVVSYLSFLQNKEYQVATMNAESAVWKRKGASSLYFGLEKAEVKEEMLRA